ncbi:hypothetical protein SCA03_04190 [Streptomyces cacaoi]|uniref:Uncharacterized protein n=1 Tax=Streptomyces cacaoi TaxID=1898 RepID=A0A4Y3QTZ3_STRCI|nr:hypothetical protein SCA03_04190 [Streptomyces cacaoi]
MAPVMVDSPRTATAVTVDAHLRIFMEPLMDGMEGAPGTQHVDLHTRCVHAKYHHLNYTRKPWS